MAFVEMVAPDAPLLADLAGRKRGGAEIRAERYRPGGRHPARTRRRVDSGATGMDDLRLLAART
jgi:hypothetical protein